MRDFRGLKVWEKAHQLTLDVYRATRSFPDEERFGLTSQMRRSAASIPSNIAEACGRGGDLEFGRFMRIAMGSASEVEYQFLLAHDLGLLTSESHDALLVQVTEVKRMLSALIVRSRGNGRSPATRPLTAEG